MELLEAKKLLRRNGYVLKEEYDAVTDHNNAKPNGDYSMRRGFMKNLARGLKEAGLEVVDVKSVITSCGEGQIQINGVYDDEYWHLNAYWELDTDTEMRGIKQTSKNAWSEEHWHGPESKASSNYSNSENTVNLELYDAVEDPHANLASVKKFDLRNIPGMVAWIKDLIS